MYLSINLFIYLSLSLGSVGLLLSIYFCVLPCTLLYKVVLWDHIINRVLQGSVLGPLLFIIYNNYFYSGISSNISKFADDTKIGRQISSEQEDIVLQGELNKMHERAIKWQMDYNINKCNTIHVGKSKSEKDMFVGESGPEAKRAAY